MQFSMSAAAFLAMAASVFAQTPDFNPVYTPEEGTVVPAGSTFEITWDAPEQYADGTISISLIGGATQGTQVPLQDIASGIPNSQESYSWTVDRALGAEAVYGLVLRLESDPSIFQFSMPFQIEGNTESVSVDSSGLPTTVTESYGTKTVTLSSAVVSSTETPAVTTTSTPAVTSSTTPLASSTPTSTSTMAHNSTITSTPVETSTTLAVRTSTQIVGTPSGTPPPSEETGAPGSGASAVGAPMALVGALAMALMAL
ncbi:hypothetical protein S7711_05597 [Stachybotrys chartarum IBT 7711]|uniref:Yeast cell wall synthesis Kre9/Knh1-like N-terminal domain-containing protein n=1 Tax=Stachybotrys chartarum (strain CBS 109288 / IBT 7711) TaxID=1280523 RepID=A0A084B4P5_STACB|nr:hypothetical protein S7711_05597 [Stachybotrys chartarum IBT 7711]